MLAEETKLFRKTFSWLLRPFRSLRDELTSFPTWLWSFWKFFSLRQLKKIDTIVFSSCIVSSCLSILIGLLPHSNILAFFSFFVHPKCLVHMVECFLQELQWEWQHSLKRCLMPIMHVLSVWRQIDQQGRWCKSVLLDLRPAIFFQSKICQSSWLGSCLDHYRLLSLRTSFHFSLQLFIIFPSHSHGL